MRGVDWTTAEQEDAACMHKLYVPNQSSFRISTCGDEQNLTPSLFQWVGVLTRMNRIIYQNPALEVSAFLHSIALYYRYSSSSVPSASTVARWFHMRNGNRAFKIEFSLTIGVLLFNNNTVGHRHPLCSSHALVNLLCDIGWILCL